jgi:hypothetical protein
VKLDAEQLDEVRQAVLTWKGYLGPLQANVILTPPRKEALATLVSLAEEALKQPLSE